MHKIIGIDPGTKSFDILGVMFFNDHEQIFLDKSIPSDKVAANPELLLSELKPYLPVDAIIGPSGYGLPLTKLANATEETLNQILPIEDKDTGGVSVNEGIKQLFQKMKTMKLPVYFTPGVIHLPTVPVYRKLNKLDIGTADKLCCVALAMKDQMQRLKIPANKTSFVLLEIGFGFTSAIAVKNGKVIDGLGGTSGFPGLLGSGHLDGELAIRVGKLPQQVLFTGGALSLINKPIQAISNLLKYHQAFLLLIESAIKDVACMLVSNPDAKELILSGRLSRVAKIKQRLIARLKFYFPQTPIVPVTRTAKIAKEAAEGAVILGAGILNFKYQNIVDALQIKQAKGTMYDYIRLKTDC
ncbi:MAG: DUF1464 family protein [candidate division WOR-3 bacterium]